MLIVVCSIFCSAVPYSREVALYFRNFWLSGGSEKFAKAKLPDSFHEGESRTGVVLSIKQHGLCRRLMWLVNLIVLSGQFS